jgi:predicted alpha/beta-fold hydrolase
LLALAEHIQPQKIYRYGLISVPFDLDAGLQNIEQGSNKIYNHYFTYQVKKSYLKKYNTFQYKDLLPVTPAELDNISSLRDFDDKITAPLNGYSSGFDYYSQNRPLRRLTQLQELSDKIGIFVSEDDPLLAVSALRELEDICADNFHYWRTPKGGHVGFVASDGLLKYRQWLLAKVFQWIDG